MGSTLRKGFLSSFFCRSAEAAILPAEEALYKTFPTSEMLANRSCNSFNGSYSLEVTPTFLNEFMSLSTQQRAKIEDLALFAQYIGHLKEDDLPHLSRAFGECSALKRLDLSSNSLDAFSKEGWLALLKAFPKDRVLESLVLTDNHLHMINCTNEAWDGFIAFIAKVPTEQINLNFNNFSKLSSDKWQELLESLKVNSYINDVRASQKAFSPAQNAKCAEMLSQKEEEKEMQSFENRYKF